MIKKKETEEVFQLQQLIENHVEKGFRVLTDRLSSGPDYNMDALEVLLNIADCPPVEEGVIDLQSHFKISDRFMEVYKIAGSNLMLEDKKEDAAEVFYCLALLSPLEPSIWLLLGNAFFHCKKYEEALISYTTASLHDTNDPRPHLWSAHALQALEQIEPAIISVENAIKVIGYPAKDEFLLKDAQNYKAFLNKL